jgi:hypothetical protein
MSHRRTVSLAFAVALAPLVGACTKQTNQPDVASSTAQPAWALAYPDQLQDAAKTLSDDRTRAQTIDGALPQRLADVKSPTDTITLLAIVKRADEAGRSEAYVARAAEDRAVRGFWTDERGTIIGRAAGTAKTVVGEAKCEGNPDVSGQVGYAVKDGVDRALEKRLRAGNDAQVIVERYKASLGTGNYAAAQKLADDVALASYLVGVALVNDENRASDLLAERQAANDTLTKAIADERAFQQDSGRTDAEKKASDDRIAQLQKSQQAIAGAVTGANVALTNADDQVKQARADHDAAVRGLEEQIQTRK